ncbi:27467_t:CDS:2, partial [Racocetra persica]
YKKISFEEAIEEIGKLGYFNLEEKEIMAMRGKSQRNIIKAGFKVPCFNLEDGTSVLSNGGMQKALKIGRQKINGYEAEKTPPTR